MRQKLNLITLGVNNLEKSLEFYEKGLSWKKSASSTDNLALFPLGGIVLALYPRKLLAEDATVSDTPTGFSGITFSYNAKSEQEVDRVIGEVEKLGATIAKPPQKVFWGGYSGYFKDPDGHLIEVAFNPLWELDENDNLDLPLKSD
jgi:catechol 2,3-dioxygenase-like lactoylglutathione lyase family enzyme